VFRVRRRFLPAFPRRRDGRTALSRCRSLPAMRREVLEAAHDDRPPAGLVAGADPASGVAMEVLVKQDELAPAGIAGEALVAAVAGPPPLGVREEERGEAPRDLPLNLPEVHPDPGARRTLDAKA